MTRLKTLVAAATFMVAFFVAPARAQLICFMATTLPDFQASFKEKAFARGALGDGGDKVIFLANQKTGTWTIVVDKSEEGVFCPVVSGKDFKLTQPEKRGQDIRWNQKL